MDVYSAESAVKRLQAFVDSTKSDSRTVYEKTKMRYRSLADSLEELAHDFRMLSSEDIDVMNPSSLVPYYASQNHRDLSALRKQTIKRYAEVIMNVHDYSADCYNLKVLSNVVREWWKARIMKSKEAEFRYRIQNLPKWISALVCVYGNKVSLNLETAFLSDFRDWCSTATTHQYPLPVDVQHFISDENENVSLTSVILWDMMYDTSLKYLSQLPCAEAQISDDLVFNLAESRSPQNLDKYENYQDNPDILLQANIK